VVIESLSDFRDKAFRFLSSTFKEEDGRAGWGLNKKKIFSITNTCEAILAYHDLDGFQDNFAQTQKAKVVTYLSAELKKMMDSDRVRVRDLACAVLSLSFLGDTTLKEAAVQRLISSSLTGGGWSEFIGSDKPCLVQSYYALLCLQRLGENIDPKHLNWLSLLQKENHGCAFWQDDVDSSFGSSSLVLYLATILGGSDKTWVRSLAQKTNDDVKQVFSKLQSNDSSWISYDRHSSFNIYGYGHAISALNFMRFNLFDSSLSDFLNSIDSAISSEDIPAYREAAIAMRAIRLNYDPFQYFKSTTKEIATNIEHSMEIQRQNLIRTSDRLKIYQNVIDEWEKDNCRQRHELPQIMITEFIKYRNERWKKSWNNFLNYALIPSIFLFAIWALGDSIITKTLTPVNFFAIISGFIPLVSWGFKIRKKPKEMLTPID
jgi:hypothetical protein